MSPVAEERNLFRASLDLFAGGLAEEQAPWLRRLRASARARFEEKGFPTTRDEAWRKTSVARIAGTAFRPAVEVPVTERDLATLRSGSFDLPGLRGPRTVLVNGVYSPALSDLGASKGLEIRSLRDVLAREPERLEPRLARVLGDGGHAFADLNTAFARDGAVVFIAPGAVIEEPVHLLYLSQNPGPEPTVSFPRTLVVAGRESQATVIESYRGPEGQGYLTDAVTEVVVEDGASLDHYRLQAEGESAYHVATLAVRQGRDARFSNLSLSFGAALSRTDIEVLFEGEGGESTLLGLFMADGERLSDTHTRIDHAVPHCTSRELYKGVLDGAARGVFDGLIVVRKDAQKTDAAQTNKNLLLSRRSLVDSNPRLEILADDVKCKHGSTTGQLDPLALFYLRSRGIAEAAARALLTYAFASDVVQRIAVGPLRAAVTAHLQAHLPSAGEIKEAFA